MQIPSISLDFDFLYESHLDGKIYRRFTTTGATGGSGEFLQGGFGLTANLREPIVLDRKSSNTPDYPHGTLGRCGYLASKLVQGIGYHGFMGRVVTVESGVLPIPANITTWLGNAIPQGQSYGYVRYYIRPWNTAGWNQTGAPWAFEAGIVCGNITAGLVQAWPQNGCPSGTNWSTANLAGHTNWYRGKVRAYTTSFGSLTALFPPNYTQQQAQLLAASLPGNAFTITVT
jgi:hypothetical protein